MLGCLHTTDVVFARLRRCSEQIQKLKGEIQNLSRLVDQGLGLSIGALRFVASARAVMCLSISPRCACARAQAKRTSSMRSSSRLRTSRARCDCFGLSTRQFLLAQLCCLSVRAAENAPADDRRAQEGGPILSQAVGRCLELTRVCARCIAGREASGARATAGRPQVRIACLLASPSGRLARRFTERRAAAVAARVGGAWRSTSSR